ncbi:hypothetical protein CCACVL1_11416 [Corchorus capsularis]|uniref:Uncharacterized protein n=1 Tax=Corchorus capsularis TaxID=210143 RepID=A0A1R3ILA7_COCAP|nr:hypothetical protein CCACVL1_11416 [Corchorus capsularis]
MSSYFAWLHGNNDVRATRYRFARKWRIATCEAKSFLA